MNIGWVGIGKLGFPCALCLNVYGGHDVFVHDKNSATYAYLVPGTEYPFRETGIKHLAEISSIHCASMQDLVEHSDIIFVAVQTPHAPEYGGEDLMPTTRADFDYSYLKSAIQKIVDLASSEKMIVVVSTVLPGTMDREIRPILKDTSHKLVYNPFFIAMGTTVEDFMNPEFVLIGYDGPRSEIAPLRELYSHLHNAPIKVVSTQSAELAKVAYNTFISTKITFANAIMEICDKTEADCDEVFKALAYGTRRLLSPAYLRGGMGDGGACHPRDNIAMSWLAQELDLSYDLMGETIKAREAQTDYLADCTSDIAVQTHLPVAMLGKAYKAESDLTAGSPALLLSRILTKSSIDHEHWDPYVDKHQPKPELVNAPHLFVIATRHIFFLTFPFPAGSIVVDPFGYIRSVPEGVTVHRIGRKNDI